jgi:hypothetical protein
MKFEWREQKRQQTLNERFCRRVAAFARRRGGKASISPTPFSSLMVGLSFTSRLRATEKRMEIDRDFQRQVLHGYLDVARGQNTDHFNEA